MKNMDSYKRLITRKEFFEALEDSIQLYKYDNIYFPRKFSHNGYLYSMTEDIIYKLKENK